MRRRHGMRAAHARAKGYYTHAGMRGLCAGGLRAAATDRDVCALAPAVIEGRDPGP